MLQCGVSNPLIIRLSHPHHLDLSVWQPLQYYPRDPTSNRTDFYRRSSQSPSPGLPPSTPLSASTSLSTPLPPVNPTTPSNTASPSPSQHISNHVPATNLIPPSNITYSSNPCPLPNPVPLSENLPSSPAPPSEIQTPPSHLPPPPTQTHTSSPMISQLSPEPVALPEDPGIPDFATLIGKDLAAALKDVGELLGHFPFVKTIGGLTGQFFKIVEVLTWVWKDHTSRNLQSLLDHTRSKPKESMGQRILHHQLDQDLQRDYEKYLHELWGTFQLEIALGTNQKVVAMERNIATIPAQLADVHAAAKEGNPDHIDGTEWRQKLECSPNTCEHILDEIEAWALLNATDSRPPVAHFLGVAGLGKTTVAHSVAHRPLKVSKKPPSPLLIVMDALDECSEGHSLLKLLLEVTDSIRGHIKIFFTSRPERKIDDILKCQKLHPIQVPLHDASNNTDIRTYFENRLPRLLPYRDTEVFQLSCKASGLFIWASTIWNPFTIRPQQPRIILKETSGHSMTSFFAGHTRTLGLVALHSRLPSSLLLRQF
ncbi:hypothetical protein JAAARDRAFT_46538 [Jaapia argillacea MUCL 33604]|uniref:Nephrocystin 3-like N-terminal domain-containing protein n=1 Tax=Jaapia argillacea MUCL 33604 TaxID=933084 RepID=A0A067Q5U2_9AGAM|nr:hypothetical protein JAAARDRAFT_46538 [Jaapia argillacea MUCL 33604]